MGGVGLYGMRCDWMRCEEVGLVGPCGVCGVALECERKQKHHVSLIRALRSNYLDISTHFGRR